jgi:hypothetical protein
MEVGKLHCHVLTTFMGLKSEKKRKKTTRPGLTPKIIMMISLSGSVQGPIHKTLPINCQKE